MKVKYESARANVVVGHGGVAHAASLHTILERDRARVKLKQKRRREKRAARLKGE